MYNFFLYPYTHVSVKNGAFIYNTLNNEYIEDNSPEVSKFIGELLDSSVSCIKVDQNLLDKKNINKFVNKVRDSYAGDLVEASKEDTSPVQLIEELKIHKNNEAVDKTDLGVEILDYFNNCLLYINSECDKKCKDCGEMFKQFAFCKKNKCGTQIELHILKDLVNTLSGLGIQDIQISGGDLFAYPFLKDFFLYVRENNINPTFLINQKHITHHSELLIVEEMAGFNIKLLVNDLDFYVSNSSFIQKVLKQTNVSYQFTIETESEINKLEAISETLAEANVEIAAFHNNNSDFFKEMVYITKDDLFEENHSLNSIFSNKAINKNFFGSLIINCDLKVYSSFNKPRLGTIGEDSFQELIYKEISNISTWKLTRDHLPVCKNCNYCFLCPAPSNYELILNRSNLCHIAFDTSKIT